MKSELGRPIALLFAACIFGGILTSCSNPAGTDPVITTLPGSALPGSRAFVLTGSAIDAVGVTINGLSLDASTVSSVSDSAVRIFASNYADGTLIASAAAGKADVTVDFSSPGTTVSDIYYGADIQIISKQFLADPLYKALLGNLKIDIIRFPAGQERVRYDRFASADTPFMLGNGAEYQYLLTGADVANYIALCNDLHIQADPQFNVDTNDPAMWSSMTDQIVKGLGYDLRYMSVGNEPDINPTGIWTYLNADSMSTALTSYMSRYSAYSTAIRAIKPDITFMLGEIANNSDPTLAQILGQIMPLAKSNPPGAVSVHWYLLGDWGQPTTSPDYPSIDHLVVSGNSGVNIRNLSKINATMRSAIPAGTKLTVGEWATSWSATAGGVAVQNSLATAIYTAEVMEYGKVLGIDCMQYFGLSDPADSAPWETSMIVANAGTYSVRPQYYMRMMYKYAWGSIMIPVPNGQTDNFSIYASKDGMYDYLMLINRSSHASYTETIKVITAAEPSGTNVEALLLPKSVTVIKLPG